MRHGFDFDEPLTQQQLRDCNPDPPREDEDEYGMTPEDCIRETREAMFKPWD